MKSVTYLDVLLGLLQLAQFGLIFVGVWLLSDVIGWKGATGLALLLFALNDPIGKVKVSE